jgi:ribosomal protein L31
MKEATKLDNSSTIEIGDVIVYYNDTISKEEPVHSGKVIEVDSEGNATRIRSKWGDGPLYEHDVSDVHPSYGSRTEYYRRKEE